MQDTVSTLPRQRADRQQDRKERNRGPRRLGDILAELVPEILARSADVDADEVDGEAAA